MKKIILFILLFSSFVYSSRCEVRTCKSDEYVKVFEPTIENAKTYCSNLTLGTTKTYTCSNSSYLDETEAKTIVPSKSGTYCNYTVERTITKCVECNEPDIEPTLPTQREGGTWQNIGYIDCHNTQFPFGVEAFNSIQESDRFESVSKDNCCEKTEYYRFIEDVPPLECSEGFTNVNEDTESECTNEIEDLSNTYTNVQGSFITENNQNICCAKWDIPDNNDTGKDSSPPNFDSPNCESPAIERPSYIWSDRSSDTTDHNTCAGYAVGNQRWWTFPSSGTVEKCCIGTPNPDYVAPTCEELKPTQTNYTFIVRDMGNDSSQVICNSKMLNGGDAHLVKNCCFERIYNNNDSSNSGDDSTNNDSNNNSDSNAVGSSSSDGSSTATTATNDILSDIKSDINTSNNTLDDIAAELNASNMSLKKIELNTGATANNTKVIADYTNGLKELMKDNDELIGSAKESYRDSIENATNAKNSLVSNFSSISSSLTAVPAVFIATGGCDVNFNIFGRSASFSLCWLTNLKPYFDILFALILAYINFKMYTRIFMFLVLLGV